MANELPELPPDVLAVMEKLASEIPSLPSPDEAMRRFEWLLDALILRGQVPERFRVLARKIQADRGVPFRLATATDKYNVDSPDVPCGELIPLCGARCCSFEVALSKQDVVENKLPFQIERPYMLPRDPVTKRCTCMNSGGGCTVYDVRPATCRTYDCREDRRVWIDYEKRIPAPLPENLQPLPGVQFTAPDDPDKT